eukprot:3927461-Amphidinium_carterae.1
MTVINYSTLPSTNPTMGASAAASNVLYIQCRRCNKFGMLLPMPRRMRGRAPKVRNLDSTAN